MTIALSEMPIYLLKPIYVSIKPAIVTMIVCFWLADLLADTPRTRIAFQRPRLGCLDGMRGYLALGVALYHYTLSCNYLLMGKWITGSAWYTLMGESAVAIFFMITGFLFWHRVLLPENHISWGKFFLGRFLRLTPVYWFSISVILTILFIFKQINFEYSQSSVLKQIILWFFYIRIPMTDAFPYATLMAGGSSWSLKCEWIFYLVLPVFATIFKLKRLGNLLLGVIAVAMIFLALERIDIRSLQINTCLIIYFLFGIGAAYLYQNTTFRVVCSSKITSLVAIGALAILFKNYESAYYMPQSILLAIFFIPVCMGNSLFGLLKLRASLLLGEMSYSLYLLHGIFLYSAYLSFNHAEKSVSLSAFQIWAGMIVFGVLIVLFSLGSYVLIEKPFIRLGKKIFP